MSLNNKFVKWVIVIALILSLVITGINSNIMNPGDDNVVATIGKQTITREEYSEVYKNHAYYVQSMFNFGLSEKQLREFGLHKIVLNQLIQEKVLMELFRKANFEIGEKATINAIRGNKNFQTDGKFDRKKFNSFLSNAGITEEELIKKVQFDIGRDIIFDLFFNIPWDRSGLAKKIYEFQYQTRKIAITHVDGETEVQIKEPTEDELREFYEKNKILTQEYRTAEYLVLSDENIKPELIKITDDEILAKFNELDLDRLFDIDYIEFPSRGDAENVRGSIASNAEYYQNDMVHLTNKFKHELPEVFHRDLKWDGNKWSMFEYNNRFYLAKIVNITTISDEERQKKLAEIRKFLTMQKLEDIAEAIERDLANSRPEEVASKYGLMLKKIGPIARNSRDKNDDIVEINASILKSIFQTDENRLSGFVPVGDEYVNAHVTSIERERALTFEEAKQETTELLRDQLRGEELAKIALAQALDGKDLPETSDLYRESIKFERSPEQDFPESFTNEVFNLNPGQITKAYRYKEGFIVGKLIETKAPEENDLIIKKFENKIRDDLALSLISELTDHYTKEFNIKVNNNEIRQ